MSELSRQRISGNGRRGRRRGRGLAGGRRNRADLRGTQGELGRAADFRFAMEHNKGHVTDGGSARQATVKELPVSKGLAGVSMRLNPGGIRELHWHAIAAEWAFVIKGRVRTTVIGPDGTSEINDFDPATSGTFPAGTAHAQARPGETHSS